MTQQTNAERVSAYDRESFARILNENLNSVESIQPLCDFLAAVKAAPKVGGSDALAALGNSQRYHVEASLRGLDRTLSRFRKEHADNRDRVEAEDAAEKARLDAIAAADAKAIADKEARRMRFEELKALQAEFSQTE
jgi:hypothetical protein